MQGRETPKLARDFYLKNHTLLYESVVIGKHPTSSVFLNCSSEYGGSPCLLVRVRVFIETVDELLEAAGDFYNAVTVWSKQYFHIFFALREI